MRRDIYRISKELARITNGETTVVISNEGEVLFDEPTTDEQMLMVGEALIVCELLKKSDEKTFYVFYDRIGLRITENANEAPEGALVVYYGEFFERRIINLNPPKPVERWKFKKKPKSSR